MANKERFQVDYNDKENCVALFDNEEQAVYVLSKEQVEALIDWYCLEFGRI